MRSSLQETLLVSLATVLRPIARLMLQAGLGSSEFIAVAKSVFVHVATDEFGLRGRPTNVSRVSAMTGISRKEIAKIRDEGPIERRLKPDLETTPTNTVIHYWHYDPEFSLGPGKPRPLPFSGLSSFATLVAKYAGDIPPGAIRAELRRGGIIDEQEGVLLIQKRIHLPLNFDEDLIRRITFSMSNLNATVAYNAQLFARRNETTDRTIAKIGRFERSAWTDRLAVESVLMFRDYVRREGNRFLEEADAWLGEHEIPRHAWPSHTPKISGVGLYYFEEDEPDR
jgi:hypothetical protein